MQTLLLPSDKKFEIFRHCCYALAIQTAQATDVPADLIDSQDPRRGVALVIILMRVVISTIRQQGTDANCGILQSLFLSFDWHIYIWP